MTSAARIIAALKLPRMAAGSLAITPSAANTPTSAAVTFPAGLFDSTPNVQVTAQTSAPGTAVTGVGVSGMSKTGCTIWLTRTNTTATGVNWLAVET